MAESILLGSVGIDVDAALGKLAEVVKQLNNVDDQIKHIGTGGSGNGFGGLGSSAEGAASSIQDLRTLIESVQKSVTALSNQSLNSSAFVKSIESLGHIDTKGLNALTDSVNKLFNMKNDAGANGIERMLAGFDGVASMGGKFDAMTSNFRTLATLMRDVNQTGSNQGFANLSGTLTDLKTAVNALKGSLDGLKEVKIDTAQFDALVRALEQVKSASADAKNSTQDTADSGSQLSDVFANANAHLQTTTETMVKENEVAQTVKRGLDAAGNSVTQYANAQGEVTKQVTTRVSAEEKANAAEVAQGKNLPNFIVSKRKMLKPYIKPRKSILKMSIVFRRKLLKQVSKLSRLRNSSIVLRKLPKRVRS